MQANKERNGSLARPVSHSYAGDMFCRMTHLRTPDAAKWNPNSRESAESLFSAEGKLGVLRQKRRCKFHLLVKLSWLCWHCEARFHEEALRHVEPEPGMETISDTAHEPESCRFVHCEKTAAFV